MHTHARSLRQQRRSLALAMALLLSTHAFAERQISAREAVEIALARGSDVALAQANLDAAHGRLQTSEGRFDPALRFNATVSRERAELIPAIVRQQTGNRVLLESLDREFSEVADELERQLAESPATLSLQCQPGSEIIINDRNICEDPEVAQQRQRLDDLLTTLARSAGGDDDLQLDIAQLQADLRAANREFNRELIDTLRTVARGNRNARRDLGDIPENQVVSNLTLDLSWNKPLRNGWSVTPQIIMETVDDNFQGKPISSRFGGKGLKRATRSAFGVTITAPLGRGGRAAVGAASDAARLRADAAAQALRFVAQRTSAQVLGAYWQLAGLQRQMQLAHQQLRAREELVQIGNALLEADEIAAAELGEPRAQLLQAEAELSATQSAYLAAHERLRLLLGLEPHTQLRTTSEFPKLGPSQACLPELAQLYDNARSERGDLTSLQLSQAAAEREILAAKDGLKPRWDLSLTMAYGGREENSNIFEGYQRSLFEELAGPSILLTLSGEIAPNNGRARGALAQSVARGSQAQIQAEEAQRQTERDLVGARQRLELFATELRYRSATSELYKQLLDNTRYALKAGELSPSDALTTELDAFDAQSSLIQVRQAYASAIADLAFRSGSLIAVSSSASTDSTPLPQLKPGAELWPWPCSQSPSNSQ